VGDCGEKDGDEQRANSHDSKCSASPPADLVG
jgi:hypothetical protein